MKYKKVQLLEDLIREMGLNYVEAAYKIGVRYETICLMKKKGNIVVDGSIYNATKQAVNNAPKGIIFTVSEYMDEFGLSYDDLAKELGLQRQSVILKAGNGSIIYEGRVYSTRRFRLDKE